MRICHTSPVKRPIDEGGRYKDDGDVGEDNAPVRENPFVEVAREETFEPVTNLGY